MEEFSTLLLAAFLGALLVLVLQRIFRRRRQGGATGKKNVLDPGDHELERQDWIREAKRAGQGLRDFAHEVEERLDLKLDRLEKLVRKARTVMDSSRGPGTSSASSSGPVSARKDPADSGGQARGEPLGTGQSGTGPAGTRGGGPLGTVSTADRERVLELAAMGTLPEQIAESVGLPGGEVDLIRRMHRSAARVQYN